jgi:lipid A ethanolaminephosphotransferase
MAALGRRDTMLRKPWSLLEMVLLVSVWLATACNLPLWWALWHLPDVSGLRGMLFGGVFVLIIASAIAALSAWLNWRWTVRVWLSLLVLVAAFSTHYMRTYGIVVDTPMVTNVLQTDWRESRDQLSWRLVWTVLLLSGPALWLIWRVPLKRASLPRQFLYNVVLFAGGLLTCVLLTLAVFQDFSSLMRNHTQLRYLINPLNAVYALGEIAFLPTQRDRRLHPLGEDARIVGAPKAEAPLFLLVVGETARSGNFSLNGYARNTNPKLALENVQSFRNVMACGTSTAASLPCMFSHLGKEAFEVRQHDSENLLDVLQRAGYAVFWLDNQSGCKGLCDRIPHTNTSELKHPRLCSGGECLDEIMLERLPSLIEALPAERRAKGTVVVLHPMGSHGPAYSRRSPPAFKAFQPECTSKTLSDCRREEVVNAYDNSIVYTDHVLAELIGWLKKQNHRPTGLMYIADHGESLGENNLYLHGLPYAIAPEVQKKVPLITWFSPAFSQQLEMDMQCVAALKDQAWHHDHLFHTVLGMMQVQTAAYQVKLDMFKTCRR